MKGYIQLLQSWRRLVVPNPWLCARGYSYLALSEPEVRKIQKYLQDV
jgi:hypothetical protein